jgi:uncharacterized membrane protein YeaQ/YmgE (transglycosylase-associated protein family)
MEILLPLIAGAAYGAVLHFLMPGRDSRGAALAPILGALLGAAPWLAMTWAGLTTESPWLWLVSLAVPAAIVPLALIGLRRARATRDARERIRLGIA